MENDRGEISIPKLEISEDKVVWEGSYTLVPVEYQEEFIEKQTKS